MSCHRSLARSLFLEYVIGRLQLSGKVGGCYSDNFLSASSSCEDLKHTIRVATPVTNHVRDFVSALEEYKAVQFFFYVGR